MEQTSFFGHLFPDPVIPKYNELSLERSNLLGLHKRIGGESERSNEMAFCRVGVTSSNILIIFLQAYTTTCNAAHLKWTDLFDKISIINRLPGLKIIDESLLEKFSIKKVPDFHEIPLKSGKLMLTH